jgi:hypothetical protein
VRSSSDLITKVDGGRLNYSYQFRVLTSQILSCFIERLCAWLRGIVSGRSHEGRDYVLLHFFAKLSVGD